MRLDQTLPDMFTCFTHVPRSSAEMTDEHKQLIEDAWASSTFAAHFQCTGFIEDFIAAPSPPPEPEPEE